MLGCNCYLCSFHLASPRDGRRQARSVQQQRGYYNAHIFNPSGISNLCALDAAGERTLEMAVRRMGTFGVSAR
jgi:hypothetical protein